MSFSLPTILPGRGARVVALGHYQPSRIVTNAELSSRIDTTDEWIRSRVGVRTRHIAAPEESVTDMATAAAVKALEASGLAASAIDLVTVATCTPVIPLPNVATQVAAALHINAPAAYDINTACSGFSYALATAHHAILAGSARHALVIGAEKLSDWTDWNDRTTCVIFGDGAGAAVVSASDTEGIGPVVWGSDGVQGSTLRVESRDGKIQQDGQKVFRWATSSLAPIAMSACKQAGIEPAELAAFIPHQANVRIVDLIAGKLGLGAAVVARDIIESGNTSSASIPMALSKLTEQRQIPSGAPVLLFGFGGGLTYAGQVIASP
ncbi:MAG: 3-oxoacyl-ACP synthase [Acidimicrobiales bacterium]|nr:MAG: 3-oxoacyl-ACP synthase [Acidimicrobiales bacterium]